MQKIKLLLVLFASTIICTHAQTQYIKGLTVIAEFTDAPFTESIDSVSLMMNQTGFNGWGNDGSFRDFYLLQSNGKVDFTNTVIKISLNYPVADYYDNNTRHDMVDIIEQINLHYPDGFQDLTTYPDGSIMHFSVLTKAGKGAWSFGDQNVDPIKNNGIDAKVVNGSLTHYGHNSHPQYNTIAHETGHAVHRWADYYYLNSAFGQLGHYCVMGSGGSDARPMPVCAPLRYLKGWINTVNDITNANTQTFSINTNDYTQVYKYTNSSNTKEYFLIDAHKHGGSYLAVDGENFPLDEGLAVWYVDEDRGNGTTSPYIKLIQADGVDEMNDPSFDTPSLKVNLRGDLTDLYDNQFPTLNDASNPLLRWKNGSLTGLSLSNISAVNTVMTFQFNSANTGCSGLQAYCAYPCIYNMGDMVVYNGTKYKSLANSLYNVTPGTAPQWWEDMGVCGTSNTAPVVTLTAPTVLSYSAPATINIAADATDDVAVTKVEFYNGTTLLNTDLTAPYTYTWTSVANGNYTITAKAYDNEGLSTVSTAINVVVTASNTAPQISVTAPLAVNGINPKYLVGGSQTVSANVTDDVAVEKVVFTLVKSGVTVTDYNAPYTATFSNLQTPYGDGSLYYTIVAYDNEGLTTSQTVFVYKNNVPSVTITSPSSNETLTNDQVVISAMVFDNDWTSGKVEYFNGTTKLGETTSSTVGSTPVNFTWNNVANGTYTISAKATDDMGEFATSTSITFTVNKTTATCSAPVYSASTAYTTGSVVQYNGIKYTANWWTMGDQPDLHNGGSGSGMPWTSNGVCNARTGAVDAVVLSTSIYPNPTHGSFTIQSEKDAPAQILNAYGKEVASFSLVEGQNEINLSLASGIYYVRIYNNVSKLVIE